MKRALRWIIGIVACLLLLAIILFLFRNPILREFIEYQVERETGVEASVGSLQLDLLAGSVRVSDFKLANPPGFGERPMLHVPELFMRIDPESPPGGLRFLQAGLNVAEFNIVRSADGRTNVFALEKRLRERKKKKKKRDDTDLEFHGVAELKLTLGTVRYIDMQKPSRSQEFRLGIENEVFTGIKTEKDLETWATALLLRIAIQQALEKSQENRGNLLDLLSPRNR
jgi:hypothetical protein